MAVRVKIDPVDREIAAMVRSDLSRGEQAKAAAQFAREGFQEADQNNALILGRKVPHTVTVDGARGVPLESVNPDGGSIIFEWEVVTDVLKWIADTLKERSPRVSGDYIAGHTLFADGAEVPIGAVIPNAEEYVFLNTVPYSRKIEVGKTKTGRAFVIQVENRIYERTARDARSRFGNVADISFAFRQTMKSYRIRRSSFATSASERAWRPAFKRSSSDFAMSIRPKGRIAWRRMRQRWRRRRPR
jgi:hypothetical protein